MSSRNKISLNDLSEFVEEEEDNNYDEDYNNLDNDFYDSPPPVGGGGGGRSDRDNEETTPNVDDGEMQHVINQVVRLALTRELNGKKIRSDHIAKYIKHNFGRKLTSIKLIEQANIILKEVYGLSIEEISTNNTIDNKQKIKSDKEQPATKIRKINTTSGSSGGSTSSGGKGPYIIVNNLSSESRNILGELWNKDLRISFKKPDITSRLFFLPEYEKTFTPGSHYELIKTGIMLVIISMVILNENHIQEVILFKKLKKFGISDNLNQKNSNINMNCKDLLNDLIDKDYLSKKKLKGRTESEDIYDYSLGKRSLVEFSPQGVFEYIKIIYGDNYDSNIGERALITIEKAYGVALVEANESNNNNITNEEEEEQIE